MRRSNCLFAAVAMVWRLWRHPRGVVFWVRWSDHIWGLHWGVESRDRRHILHYVPDVPANLPYALLDKLWYRGHLKFGDARE